MNFAFGFAIYFVVWWVTLFAILPFGVRPQGESEEGAVPGSAGRRELRIANRLVPA